MRYSFRQRLLLSAVVLFFTLEVISQNSEQINSNIYKLNYKLDLGLAVGGVISNFIGLRSIMDKPTLDSAKILSHVRNDIWFIDKGATKQKATNNDNANFISDWAMNVTIVLPALLVIDDKIRKDWMDILLLYIETHSITANLYAWGGPKFISIIIPNLGITNILYTERH